MFYFIPFWHRPSSHLVIATPNAISYDDTDLILYPRFGNYTSSVNPRSGQNNNIYLSSYPILWSLSFIPFYNCHWMDGGYLQYNDDDFWWFIFIIDELLNFFCSSFNSFFESSIFSFSAFFFHSIFVAWIFYSISLHSGTTEAGIGNSFFDFGLAFRMHRTAIGEDCEDQDSNIFAKRE